MKITFLDFQNIARAYAQMYSPDFVFCYKHVHDLIELSWLGVKSFPKSEAKLVAMLMQPIATMDSNS